MEGDRIRTGKRMEIGWKQDGEEDCKRIGKRMDKKMGKRIWKEMVYGWGRGRKRRY